MRFFLPTISHMYGAIGWYLNDANFFNHNSFNSNFLILFLKGSFKNDVTERRGVVISENVTIHDSLLTRGGGMLVRLSPCSNLKNQTNGY